MEHTSFKFGVSAVEKWKIKYSFNNPFPGIIDSDKVTRLKSYIRDRDDFDIKTLQGVEQECIEIDIKELQRIEQKIEEYVPPKAHEIINLNKTDMMIAHSTNDHTLSHTCYRKNMTSAIHVAYEHHFPLTLKPSYFLITIAQGLSLHINQNAEMLRHLFVDHEGQEEITLRRDDFTVDGDNDWESVFPEFSSNIQSKLNIDLSDIMIDNFQSGTSVSRAVSHIVLMDSMKSYLKCSMESLCGIPEITLDGPVSDWLELKNKVIRLKALNVDDTLQLNWWLDHLVPLITKVCDTAINREVDVRFWSRLYKEYNGSGGSFVSGWINTLYPYREYKNSGKTILRYYGSFQIPVYECTLRYEKNMCVDPSINKSTNVKNFPLGITEVPFNWNYLGQNIPMKIYGGFTFPRLNPDKSVEPELFWAVVRCNVTEDE